MGNAVVIFAEIPWCYIIVIEELYLFISIWNRYILYYNFLFSLNFKSIILNFKSGHLSTLQTSGTTVGADIYSYSNGDWSRKYVNCTTPRWKQHWSYKGNQTNKKNEHRERSKVQKRYKASIDNLSWTRIL